MTPSPTPPSQQAPDSAAEVLRRAADLIEPEGAWTQYAFGRDERGHFPSNPAQAVCFCAAGAICAAAGRTQFEFVYEGAEGEALRLFERAVGTRSETFNDSVGRTQAEVVSALREAAKLAEAAQ